MKIAVDAMGGDQAPHEIVAGAVDAARSLNLQIILVGIQERIESELDKHDIKNLPIFIQHAAEVVTMDDSPSKAMRRKRESSIAVGLRLVRDGRAQGFISAGNSGATMAIAMVTLKKLKGIDRPAIVTCLPTLKEPVTILDVGANVDCSPLHLAQFAIMGSIYAQRVLNRNFPKVGLLSNGEEESKGNELTRATHELLKNSPLNYLGSVEGRDIFPGDIDVIVCDGFVGNIVLKTSEGLALAMTSILREELTAGIIRKAGAWLCRNGLKGMKKRVDYAEYGGAPLLGINGNCFIAHGSSCRKAIKNGIRLCAEFSEQRVNDYLLDELDKNHEIQKLLPKKKLWNQIKERIIPKDSSEEEPEEEETS
ncbi:MAG: phosphate acyltransferase PlsX [Deltaproteobacteria bacterium]|nr:phosphate acyltransferase PlsX [Candidatus Tharpella aukensis]